MCSYACLIIHSFCNTSGAGFSVDIIPVMSGFLLEDSTVCLEGEWVSRSICARLHCCAEKKGCSSCLCVEFLISSSSSDRHRPQEDFYPFFAFHSHINLPTPPSLCISSEVEMILNPFTDDLNKSFGFLSAKILKLALH